MVAVVAFPPLCELLTVIESKIVWVNGERVAVGVLLLLLLLWLLLLHFPPLRTTRRHGSQDRFG